MESYASPGFIRWSHKLSYCLKNSMNFGVVLFNALFKLA